MNDKHNMQDVWAATDKPLIDRMRAKTSQAPTRHNHFTSSEESSDSDTDNISEASFLAVPREFRPNLAPKQPFSMNNKIVETPSLNQVMTRPLFSSKYPKNGFANDKACLSLNSTKSLAAKTNNNLNKVDTTKTSIDGSKLLNINRKEQTLLNLQSTCNPNTQDDRSSNYICMDRETTPLKTKWFSSKPDNCSKTYTNQTDAAEKLYLPKQGTVIGTVRPRNDKEHLEILGKTKVFQKFSDKAQMQKKALSNYDPKAINSIGQEKVIEFECMNVSKHVKTSKSKTFELDVANMTLDIKTSRTITDSSKFQILPDHMKTITPYRKKKYPKRYNYSNKRDNFNIKQLPNSTLKDNSVKWHDNIIFNKSKQSPDFVVSATENKKEGFVKWHDTIDLNNSKHIPPDFLISTTEYKTNRCSKTSDKTVEWTASCEKNICFSVKKLSISDKDDEDKESKTYQLNDNYEITNLNLSNFSEGLHPLKGTAYVKNDKSCAKQAECTSEEINHLEQYSCKGNINKNYDFITNKNNEMSHQKQTDSCNITHTGNTFKQRNYSGSCINKASKLSDRMNEVNPRTLCEQFVNFSVQQETLPPKAGNKEIVKEFKLKQEPNVLIQFGKEISDLIMGSHTALSTLFSIYGEWKLLRCKLIDEFKQLEKNILKSSDKCKTYKDLLEVGAGIATLATLIPFPYVNEAGKIISVFVRLASKYLLTPNIPADDTSKDEPEIIGLLLKDIAHSTELYMHGLQCNLQFEETTKLIEEFHASAIASDFTDIKCPHILAFVQGVLEYRPQHRIFYKKLHKCFQEILQNGSSNHSRQFCEPFSFYVTNAVDVVGYLDWRFVEIDTTSVEKELNGILDQIQSSSSTSMKDLALRIKNCVRILNDELESVMNSISKIPVFENSEQNFKSK